MIFKGEDHKGDVTVRPIRLPAKNSSLASPFVGVSNILGIHARQAIKDNNIPTFFTFLKLYNLRLIRVNNKKSQKFEVNWIFNRSPVNKLLSFNHGLMHS